MSAYRDLGVSADTWCWGHRLLAVAGVRGVHGTPSEPGSGWDLNDTQIEALYAWYGSLLPWAVVVVTVVLRRRKNRG